MTNGLITSASACQSGIADGPVSSPPSGVTPTRETAISYQSFASTPLFPSSPSIFDRPSSVKTYGNGTLASETDYAYDQSAVTSVTAVGHDDTNYSASYNNRGNLSTTTRQCFVGATACTNPVIKYTYDVTGQTLTTKDPCGNVTCADMTGTSHTTNYSYTDSYTILSGGHNQGYTAGGSTNAYLTQITNPLGHTANFTYDYNTSELTASKDVNGQTTSYLYNDTFARPTLFQYPDTGQTTFAYNDTGSTPSITTSKLITSGLTLTTAAFTDAMGHPIQTQLTSDLPDGVDYTDTSYDGLARAYTLSNPHRSAASSTDGSTTYYYDALGRVCLLVPPDGTQPSGSSCPTLSPAGDSLTTYSGNCTTATDEAGHSRTSCSDSLGRITQVFENPSGLNYETDYTYDVLNNLLTVNQKGSAPGNSSQWRTRTFSYDSLSRLLTSSNPESGTSTYAYDANGNVSTKTAPKPNQTGTATVVTSYTYDVLNRLLQKSYNDGSTPTVKHGYDGATISGCTQPVLSDPNPKGRRTAMCDGSGSTAWSHDVMGRVLTKKEKLDTFNQATTYTYNLDGSVSTETYPTAHVLSYGYNGAARPISLTDTTASINYVSACQTAPCYSPPGELLNARFGVTGTFTGITLQNAFNKRLQPVTLSASAPSATVFSLSYDFHLGAGDNGNVFQIVNNRDANRTQNFLYDSLNRIQQAYTNGPNWGETFSPTATAPGIAPTTPGIDAWGNLTNRSAVTGKNTYEPLSASATNQNRLTGFGYDAAGNMTSNGSASYTYDAENQLITAGGYTYSYDGGGNRVKKTNGSSGTIYWRDASGEVIDEANLSDTMQNEYVFFSGKRIARRDVPTGHKHYYFSDHLGSASVITSDLGVIQEESDYYPYGGEIAITNGDPNTYKFTGKERDSESGLDMFGARYYGSSLGRFETADPLPWLSWQRGNPKDRDRFSAFLGNPQNLNLYACLHDAERRVVLDSHHVDASIPCWLSNLHGPTFHLKQLANHFLKLSPRHLS
jgi:RHS repeat-associated protein